MLELPRLDLGKSIATKATTAKSLSTGKLARAVPGRGTRRTGSSPTSTQRSAAEGYLDVILQGEARRHRAARPVGQPPVRGARDEARAAVAGRLPIVARYEPVPQGLRAVQAACDEALEQRPRPRR